MYAAHRVHHQLPHPVSDAPDVSHPPHFTHMHTSPDQTAYDSRFVPACPANLAPPSRTRRSVCPSWRGTHGSLSLLCQPKPACQYLSGPQQKSRCCGIYWHTLLRCDAARVHCEGHGGEARISQQDGNEGRHHMLEKKGGIVWEEGHSIPSTRSEAQFAQQDS